VFPLQKTPPGVLQHRAAEKRFSSIFEKTLHPLQSGFERLVSVNL